MDAVAQYFLAVMTDGDALNDWRTHLPASIRLTVTVLGSLVAMLRGV